MCSYSFKLASHSREGVDCVVKNSGLLLFLDTTLKGGRVLVHSMRLYNYSASSVTRTSIMLILSEPQNKYIHDILMIIMSH